MQTILVNESFNNFSCIGGECEYSCCRGWNVRIDKKTYDLYMTAAEDTVMNFRENLILTPEDSRTEFNYAKIRNNHGNCVFLDKEGLCKIHSRYGSNALSNVCNTFPRIVNLVNSEFELSWNTSCPEIIRFMLNSDKNNFYLADASKFLSGVFSVAYIYNKEDYKGQWQFYLQEIRSKINEIFWNPEFDFDLKLYIIGNIINELQLLINKNNFSMIPEYLNNINIENFTEEHQELNADYFEQLEVLYNLCREQSLTDKDYTDTFDKLIAKYKFNPEHSTEELHDIYITALNESKNNLKKFDILIENYISNSMMSTLFPFCDDNSIFLEFIKLAVNYRLFKFHLIPYFAMENPEKQELVDSIVMYSKCFLHDKELWDKLNNQLMLKENLNFLFK